MHCRFLAVNITGPWWAPGGNDKIKKKRIPIKTDYLPMGNDDVGKGVPTATI